jgi:hypothetical protein
MLSYYELSMISIGLICIEACIGNYPKKSDAKDEVEQGKSLTKFIYRHQVNQTFVHSVGKE